MGSSTRSYGRSLENRLLVGKLGRPRGPDDLLFVAMVIASPIVIAVLYLRLLRWLVKRRQILPLEPTAWDWLFLDSAKNARAAVITLRDNTKVAGRSFEGSYTALHPYARDLSYQRLEAKRRRAVRCTCCQKRRGCTSIN